MYFINFKDSLHKDFPPENIGRELKALWWEAKGNRDKAHRIVKAINSVQAAWVHAYLHRKEGDLNNASFWYTSAGRQMPDITPDNEWEEIAKAMLDV